MLMACVSEILVNSYNSHRDRPFTKSSTCNEKKGPDLCHSNYTSISVQYQNALPSFNEVHDGNVSALLFCCDNRFNGTYIFGINFIVKKSTMLHVLYIYRVMLKHNSHIQADQYSRLIIDSFLSSSKKI